MDSLPFSRYFRRGRIEDISEYLRSAASASKAYLLRLDAPQKCVDHIDETPTLRTSRQRDAFVYLYKCIDIVHSNVIRYRELLNELRTTITRIARLGQSPSFVIETSLPQLHFVKHYDQLKITFVKRLRQVQDDVPRASNILGALRWGLEKYVILKIATLDPSGFGDFMKAWLTSRGVKVEDQSGRHQREFEKFAMYYPPNVVFGASGGGKAQHSGPFRGAVSVARLEGCDGFVRLELSLDPPPVVYRILGELGVAPRDVKKALTSFLAVAAAMLSPSDTFGGQAPVPLTAYLEDSSRQRVCVETPYEVDLDLVDCVIERFWCEKNI
jgi:hypothetical protein